MLEKHQHFILHKPYGYLSQFIINGKRKQRQKLLGELYNFPKGIMAIGRLDEKSEGLLLLTTDGKVSELIRSNKYEKEYFVQVDGLITVAAINELQKGVTIGFEGKHYQTKPCKAKIITDFGNYPIKPRKVREDSKRGSSWLSITITEGKFRQVRKMTASVGFPTLRLVRVRIGNIHLAILEREVEKINIKVN